MISIFLVVQFLAFFRQLLSGYHFGKFNIFFDFWEMVYACRYKFALLNIMPRYNFGEFMEFYQKV
jgi:hypothetical protein